MRRAPRGNKQLVAARTSTGRFFQSLRWALALARRLDGRLGDFFRLPSLANPLAIPAALPATTPPATVRLPPGPAGTPRPPPFGRLLARRPTIPRLRTARHKGPLAALQKTATRPRPPAGGLPSTRSSIMLKKTQGSVNSRRSSLGEESHSSPRHFIPKALSLGLPPLQTTHPHPWPPLSRRPAATDHRRPPRLPAGELAQPPAAANR
jgi:hypothetical protein